MPKEGVHGLPGVWAGGVWPWDKHGQGACMAGGMHAQGVCMPWGMHGQGICNPLGAHAPQGAGVGTCMTEGVCMAEGMQGQGAWLGGVHVWGACMARRHGWPGACMPGHMHYQEGVHGREGVCASYWNALLLSKILG